MKAVLTMLLKSARWVMAAVVLFLLWQAWVFERPRPRAYSVAEVRAIETAVRRSTDLLAEVTPGPTRFAVAHFRDDDRDLVTEGFRDALAGRDGWTVVQGSPVNAFLRDVGRAVSEATSLDEVVHAGRRVGIDVVVSGRLLAVGSTNDTGTAAIRVGAYDTRPGAWILRDTVAAEWRPGVAQRVSMVFGRLGWFLRLVLWLAFTGLLPWVTPFVTRWALARKSNAASALAVGGYTMADMAVLVLFFGPSVSGGAGWLAFFVALAACGAYNFIACERTAAGEA
jgi:hypothetical protein